MYTTDHGVLKWCGEDPPPIYMCTQCGYRTAPVGQTTCRKCQEKTYSYEEFRIALAKSAVEHGIPDLDDTLNQELNTTDLPVRVIAGLNRTGIYRLGSFAHWIMYYGLWADKGRLWVQNLSMYNFGVKSWACLFQALRNAGFDWRPYTRVRPTQCPKWAPELLNGYVS